MYPNRNPLKVKLDNDRCIHGLYIQMAGPENVEIAAAAGFDYVILDEEHGGFSYSETAQLIRAAEASGIVPVVRVSEQSASAIRKALEAGAMGIYVPNVKNAQQAAQAIAAAKFSAVDTAGIRGACPTVRSARSRGAVEWASYVEWSNSNIMVSLLIESQEGVDNLAEILAVPGIDTIVLGRFDLAHEMGLNGDRYGKVMSVVFEKFVSYCEAANVPYLTRLSTLDPHDARCEYDDWVKRGARVFNFASDRELIAKSFTQAIQPFICKHPLDAH
ncbi:MAG: aldolase/citrate lyase family protein [Burkholderiaceae bacterium]